MIRSGQGESPPRFLEGALATAPRHDARPAHESTRARAPRAHGRPGYPRSPHRALSHPRMVRLPRGFLVRHRCLQGLYLVEFFFALSGFILFYAYGARFGAGLRAEAIRTFLAACLSRIYPLQLVTLLAVVVVEADRRIDGSRRLGVSWPERWRTGRWRRASGARRRVGDPGRTESPRRSRRRRERRGAHRLHVGEWPRAAARRGPP
jgi:hypothetical protein